MFSSLLWITFTLIAADTSDRPCLILVTGAGGTGEYTEQFQQWAARWEQAAGKAGLQIRKIGSSDTATDDRQQLQACLKQVSQQTTAPLWLVFIGHGTYASKQAKFNLHGPDVSRQLCLVKRSLH